MRIGAPFFARIIHPLRPPKRHSGAIRDANTPGQLEASFSESQLEHAIHLKQVRRAALPEVVVQALACRMCPTPRAMNFQCNSFPPKTHPRTARKRIPKKYT
jgi:hypothetical protein